MKPLLMAIAMFLMACGESPTIPTPDPTPDPSPIPTPRPGPIIFPLRVSGTNFIDAAGRRVFLLGAIAVDKSWGWPIRANRMSDLAEAGANFTHIRLGPQSPNGPDPETSPDGGLAIAKDTAFSANVLNMALEVDIVDGWVMKHDYNFFGWDCSTTQLRPLVEQLRWAERAARELSVFPNVMFQTSNEGFDCPHFGGSSKDWEFGIRDAIRRGAPGRLIATNSHGGQIEKGFDYVERHQDMASGISSGKPTMVNETGPHLTCEDWFNQAKRGKAMGTSFHLWWGDMSESEFKRCLGMLKDI